MNDQQESPRAATRNVLENVFAEIRLARATELAQSERFAEAAAVLGGAGQSGSVRELDLLARIAARQGHFAEARQLWTRALQLEPQNQIYQQCLKSLTPAKRVARIVAIHEGKLWNFLILVVAVCVIGLLFFIFRK